MSEALLSVEGLAVALATPRGVLHAVRDVSFQVNRGETLCIVGESGCGKSMTAFALMGLLPKTATRTARKLVFENDDLTHTSPERLAYLRSNRMAMIFQEPMTALNPSYTIGDQLTEVHRRHKHSTRSAARERAVELLEKVGITAAGERLGQYPHQLSGGLRQRVMIAMALMNGPGLLIADEPTTALDVTIQAQILHLLIDLQQDLGIAILLITHDLGVVARAGHHVAVMYAGEIVEAGSTDSVYSRPRHPYTKGLMASIPIPGRTAPGQRLGAIAGTVPSLIGEMSGCGFRERCSHAVQACRETIALRSDNGHGWRCILEPLGAA